MTPATLMALMVAWYAPGRSLYSQVVVPDGSPAACSRASDMLCAPPKSNPAWRGAWTRPETRAEGAQRYWQIAQMIDAVATASTWAPVPGCAPPRVVRWQTAASAACKAEHIRRPWHGSADELKRYMLTIVLHESGLRRDVHAGVGERARGDCKDVSQPTTCRATCLGQILRTSSRRKWRTQRGYTWDSLTGLDDGATRRCLETVADYLGSANAVCTSPYGPASYGAQCVLGAYGGVTTRAHPGIAQRVRTIVKLGQPAPAVPLDIAPWPVAGSVVLSSQALTR